MRKGGCFLFSLSILLPISAFASGLSKPVNVGPKAIGMGGAFVGIADDLTAIYHNPAGVSQLNGNQIYVGVDGIITDEDYTPPGAPTEAAVHEFLPVPSFGYVTGHLSPIWLGVGLFFPHGNGGKFSTSSAAPLNPKEGRIFSLEIAPSITWQVSRKLSVGTAIRVTRISSSLRGQFIPPSVVPPSGTTLEDLDLSGWGVGASAGFLYHPWKSLSFGANYRSTVKANLNGTATFAGSGAIGASLDQTLPTLITAGFGIRPTKRLTIGLSYDLERNSEITTLRLRLANGISIPSSQNWRNSQTIHLGGDYQVSPRLAVRAGYAKDLNASIPDSAMNRIVGDIAAHEVSTGIAYRWKRYILSGAWNARFGSRTVPNNGSNPGPGRYEAFVQDVSIGLGVSL